MNEEDDVPPSQRRDNEFFRSDPYSPSVDADAEKGTEMTHLMGESSREAPVLKLFSLSRLLCKRGLLHCCCW